LSHKNGAEDLLGGGMVDGQIKVEAALAVLRPLFQDPSVLKIGQNLKYDWLLLYRHGIEIAPYDDTMLISYVLEAGTQAHGMDARAGRWLGHTRLSYKKVTGSGRLKVTFDRVDLERATLYASEDADVTLRLWKVLKPQLAAKGLVSVYERLERPM